MAWSPDGRLLTAAGTDGAVHCWAANGRYVRALEGHQNTVLDVVWSPDGTRLISVSTDTFVRDSVRRRVVTL